jgi:uncharacterized protein YneF (UPF0154 family)
MAITSDEVIIWLKKYWWAVLIIAIVLFVSGMALGAIIVIGIFIIIKIIQIRKMYISEDQPIKEETTENLPPMTVSNEPKYGDIIIENPPSKKII